MKKIKIFGIIAAILLIILGIFFPVPEKHIRVSSYSYDNNWFEAGEEYVGGDAYNYQMEASLKAGWVSGVLATKSICFCSGIMLFFFVLVADNRNKELKKQTDLLEQFLSNNSTDQKTR